MKQNWKAQINKNKMRSKHIKGSILFIRTKTQSANLGGNPLCLATKRHLTVKWWKMIKTGTRSKITDLFWLSYAVFLSSVWMNDGMTMTFNRSDVKNDTDLENAGTIGSSPGVEEIVLASGDEPLAAVGKLEGENAALMQVQLVLVWLGVVQHLHVAALHAAHTHNSGSCTLPLMHAPPPPPSSLYQQQTSSINEMKTTHTTIKNKTPPKNTPSNFS